MAEFSALKERLKREALTAALDEYEIYYSEEESRSAEALGDEISGFTSSHSGGISFRCKVDGKMGYASTELFEAEEMARLVRRARDNAEAVEAAGDAVIFAGSEKYETPVLPPRPTVSADDLRQATIDVQRAAYAEDKSVVDGTQSGACVYRVRTTICNSHGLDLSSDVGAAFSYCDAVLKADGESESAFDYCRGIDRKSRGDVARCAVEKARRKIGATGLSSGDYPVIFDGRAARQILSAFCSVFSGKSALLGYSLLRGKVGQVVAAPCVTLVDDPLRPDCPMQQAFDGEGVATYRKNVIENGVLKTLLYDLTTASRAGVRTTGNGQRSDYSSPVAIAPYSFAFAPGQHTRDELISLAGNGVFITEVKGLHAGTNATTGDFSIDSEGFLIEGGKLSRPVKSFTVAGNFYTLLQSVMGFSDQVEWGIETSPCCIGSPDIWVKSLAIAGQD